MLADSVAGRDSSRPRSQREAKWLPAARRDWVLLAVIVVAAALLRSWTIASQSLWLDEYVTVELLGRGFGEMLAIIPSSEATPPLYYVLAWLWTKLFGIGEAGVRSLSVLAGTATCLVAYAIGARLGRSSGVGLVAAALVAVNPLLVWYSQEARAYALLVLLSALAFLFFVRALDGEPHRGLIGWALFSALALSTHYFAAFLVVPEAIWLLVALRRRLPQPALAVGAVAAVGAALVPLVWMQRGQGGWIATRPFSPRFADIGPEFLLGNTAPIPELWLAAATVLVIAVLLLKRGNPRERRGAGIAAAIGVSAVTLPVVAAVAGVDYLLTRNVIAALVPLIMFVALGLGVRRARRVGLAGAAVLLALSLAAVIASASDSALQRGDWRAVADALGPPEEPRIVASHLHAIPLLQYLPSSRRFEPGESVMVREIAFVTYDDTGEERVCVPGGACSMGSTPPFTLERLGGFEYTERVTVEGLTIRRFRADAVRAVDAAYVLEALRVLGLAGVEPRTLYQADSPQP